MRTKLLLPLVLLATLTAQVHAQFKPCGDKSLPQEQRWNPPNAAVTPALARFYDISDQMSRAYKNGNSAAAETAALAYLHAAKSFRCNWNYGNAIHDANSMLGLLALKSGQVAEAVDYLSAAGESPGSPQLDTFGPSMHLANELARAGQYVHVASYLRAVQRFWKMDNGSIDRWVADLEAKRAPDFSMSLRPL